LIVALASLVRGRLEEAVARAKLRSCAHVGSSPRVLGRVWIHGGGSVRIGNRVLLDGRRAPIELHCSRGAEIVFGDDVTVEGGTSLEAQALIAVGNGCRLGSFTKVLDNHFHPVKGDRHQRPQSVKVIIEDGAEIGTRAILLPGAHIEKGARIGAGAVISRRVPPGVTVAGQPPRAQ
jgi:acetyltransferase-like isoleucine patch superfamily enzyme